MRNIDVIAVICKQRFFARDQLAERLSRGSERLPAQNVVFDVASQVAVKLAHEGTGAAGTYLRRHLHELLIECRDRAAGSVRPQKEFQPLDRGHSLEQSQFDQIVLDWSLIGKRLNRIGNSLRLVDRA